jgi:hypothetical protein
VPATENPETVKKFWDRVEKNPGCWQWTGSNHYTGYGQFWVDGQKSMASRFVWEMQNGKVPEGMVIVPTCKNRGCVRPDHLKVVSQQTRGKKMFIGAAVKAFHDLDYSMFHVKQTDRDAAPTVSFTSLEESVPQRRDSLVSLLQSLGNGVAALARTVGDIAHTVGDVNQRMERFEQQHFAAKQQPPQPAAPSPEPPPAPPPAPTFEQMIVRAYADETGVDPGALSRSDTVVLCEAFDCAIAAAGGSGAGATQLFRSWLNAYMETVGPCRTPRGFFEYVYEVTAGDERSER